MGLTLDPVLHDVIGAGIGLLFLSACWHKLRDFAAFRATLADYAVLPAPLADPASRAVVLAEAGAGVGALIPASRGPALGLAVALLLLYTAAMGLNLARGRRELDCGCAGPAARQPIGEWLLLRNAVLALVAAAGLLPPAARSLGWLDFATMALALASFALLYAGANRLIAQWPRLQSLRR